MLAVPTPALGSHPQGLLLSIFCDGNRGKSGAQTKAGVRGTRMLRVETQESDEALVCRLEGRFTGDGAEQVRTLVTRCDNNLALIVDVTELLYIDAVGEDVLSLMKKLGGEFVAETAYARDICERLQLPLLGNYESKSRSSGNGNGNGRRATKNLRCR